MKYLIVKSSTHPETAIIFNPCLLHKDMIPKGFDAVAGGFVIIRGVGADAGNEKSLHIECYGESASCKVQARKQDAGIVHRDIHWPH